MCALTTLQVGETDAFDPPITPFSHEHTVPEVILLAQFPSDVHCSPLCFAEQVVAAVHGYSTFVSLPPLPEGKGTSVVRDLRVDPDEEDISVATAVSPNEAEAEETADATVEVGRKRRHGKGTKPTEKSKQVMDTYDFGSSSPPVPAGDGVTVARDS